MFRKYQALLTWTHRTRELLLILPAVIATLHTKFSFASEMKYIMVPSQQKDAQIIQEKCTRVLKHMENSYHFWANVVCRFLANELVHYYHPNQKTTQQIICFLYIALFSVPVLCFSLKIIGTCCSIAQVPLLQNSVLLFIKSLMSLFQFLFTLFFIWLSRCVYTDIQVYNLVYEVKHTRQMVRLLITSPVAYRFFTLQQLV